MLERELLKYIKDQGEVDEDTIAMEFLDGEPEEILDAIDDLVKSKQLIIKEIKGDVYYRLNLERIALSVSELQCYNHCSFLHYLDYIIRLLRASGLPLIAGSVMHKGLEYVLSGKVQPETERDYENLILEIWDSKEDELDPKIQGSAKHEKAIEGSLIHFPAYCQNRLAKIKPYEGKIDGRFGAIERYFDKEIIHPHTREPTGIYLKAALDVILSPTHVLDYKYTSGKKTKAWADFELQPAFYAMILGEEDITLTYEIIDKRVIKDIKKMWISVDTKVNLDRVYQAYRMIMNFVDQVHIKKIEPYPQRGYKCDVYGTCHRKAECLAW